ncbi:MAG TPA: DUF4169 family protein [Rhodanobacter sp.]
MGKVVNLNKVRKRKARAVAAQQAAENRVRFGRTGAQKARERAETEAAQRQLAQLRREPPDETGAEYRKFKRPLWKVWRIGCGHASAGLGTDRASARGISAR